jgi:hypothetical protein
MYTGQVDVISNKATWRSEVYELVDPDDGTTTDLTTVVGLAIVVTIKGLPNCCWTIVSGSITDGTVTVPGPGFQWQFEDTDLSGLCPGTYGLGVKVTMNGFIVDLIDGTLVVIEGN